MNAQSNKKEDKESEKAFCVHQLKGTCLNCGTYVHKSRDCTKGGEKKYCTYCKKDGHLIEEFFHKKRYEQECTYCHKNGHKEKACCKKEKYDKEREK